MPSHYKKCPKCGRKYIGAKCPCKKKKSGRY